MIETYERPDPITREEILQVIREGYENGKEAATAGVVADYIPELARADGKDFGICIRCADGDTVSFGQTKTRFSIQSISKVINLALALKFLGFREVFSHVQLEPSGDPFNSIIKLDTVNDFPFNPMINAGAIEVVNLLAEEFAFEDILAFAREFCMDDEIVLNEAVYASESETGDRNRAIAYLLKSKGVLRGDPDKTLDLYFRMCSLNVNAESLANMGLILAQGGQNPFTGKHLLHPHYVRTLKSLMLTCGMYDESGAFGVLAGLPSKSGVGGGIVSAVTAKQLGIGTYGPALNEKGNSIGGIAALNHISHRLHLNIFG